MIKFRRHIAAWLLGMYLGLSGGYLTIYDHGNKQVLPYKASMFPHLDQQALEQGIPFSTLQELSKLLEDYTA